MTERSKDHMFKINSALAEMIEHDDDDKCVVQIDSDGDATEQLLMTGLLGGPDAVTLVRCLLVWIAQEHIIKAEEYGMDAIDLLFEENVRLLGL